MKEFIVEFPGPNGMTLHGYIYIPEGKGPFPIMIHNHGAEDDPKPPLDLAAFFTSHGYILFKPIRHGQGISSSFGKNEYDNVKVLTGKCKENNTTQTDIQKCIVKVHEMYNKDVVAAVDWLKDKPKLENGHDIPLDKRRMTMMGISYGGIQTILSAEKGLGLKACLPFAPGAESWGNEQLRERMAQAVLAAQVPMFIIQAENDFSTGPVEVLGAILKLKPGHNDARMYSKFGEETQTAHEFGGRAGGMAIWGPDVINFLNVAIR